MKTLGCLSLPFVAGMLAFLLILALAFTAFSSFSSGQQGAGGDFSVEQAALQMASHLHGPRAQVYAQDQNFPKSVVDYWHNQCPVSHSPKPDLTDCYWDWQSGYLQCVAFVVGAFHLAGHDLPTSAAVAQDFWAAYANRPGWLEVPASAPPMPGDMVVWFYGGAGHIAIATGVSLPTGVNRPGSLTFAQANAPGALTTEAITQKAPGVLHVVTWPGYTLAGYIRSLSAFTQPGTGKALHLWRHDQLDPSEYDPSGPYTWAIWAYSTCSAGAITNVIDAYRDNRYRIVDILRVEAGLGEITSQLGLIEQGGIARTAARFGFSDLSTSKFAYSLEQVVAIANAGHPVIVGFPPDRFKGGHILVVTGGRVGASGLIQTVYVDDSGFNRDAIERAQFLAWWGGTTDILSPSASPPPTFGGGNLPTSQYVALAKQDAQAVGFDPIIYAKQINAESGFNPGAVSSAGAVGIAQILPTTAQGWGVNPWNPVASLRVAAQHMEGALQQYQGDYAKALASYNAGSWAVGHAIVQGGANWLAFMPLETQHYVQIILSS